MAKETEKNTFEYMDVFRGDMGINSYVTAVLLVAETKEECDRRKILNESEDQIYETMLAVADRLDILNPFKDQTRFASVYKIYCD